MKYMGHKGRIISAISNQMEKLMNDAHALGDAFCGSGIVAWALAERFDLPVLAGDLQSFAAARAASVVERNTPIQNLDFMGRWFLRAEGIIAETIESRRVPETPRTVVMGKYEIAKGSVEKTREYLEKTLSAALRNNGHRWPITLAYAGYYFSIQQALTFDALRATLPKAKGERAVALSALIGAASRCSGSPGHTAQPLGIGERSLPHLLVAWNRSVFDYVREEVNLIAPRHAKVEGETCIGSWEKMFDRLAPGDVVFCDPPYSDVQYSRFYHVLETLSRGEVIEVSGSGRNPPFKQRPESEFSRLSNARSEAERLLQFASDRELRLVITFPISRQSNGLAANTFAKIAKKYFGDVDCQEVTSTFSSLGGNGSNGRRPARRDRVERIICCYG